MRNAEEKSNICDRLSCFNAPHSTSALKIFHSFSESSKHMGRTKPAEKKYGRSPLTDEKKCPACCNLIGRDRSSQKWANRLGRSGNKRPEALRS
ncbi:hypothetical protein TNCV_669611 [Trichonephila clavipes]|nr:hypothetical protein TNCV_669611 [Trichonephila clavipes]